MANQHQAQHEQPKADPKKADPKAAQFVITLTPEQYESHLNQVAATPKDAPPRPQMAVGDTGTAKVSFTDEAGGDVKIASSTWTSMGPVTIVPDDKDPTSAALTATGPGRAPIKVDITTESGATAEAATEVMVIQTGTPTAGKIDITVQPAKSKAK